MIPIKLQRKFIETALRHGCSCVNLLHIFRTPFPKNTSEWLLMYLSQSLYHNFCYDLHIINTSKPSSTFTYLRWDLQSLHLPLQSYVILQGFLSKSYIYKVYNYLHNDGDFKCSGNFYHNDYHPQILKFILRLSAEFLFAISLFSPFVIICSD